MNTTRRIILTFGCVALLSTVAYGTDFTMKPITASGSHTIMGNQITLDSAGQIVTLEIWIDDWRSSAETGLGICNDGITVCDNPGGVDPDCPGGGACTGNNGIMGGWAATIDSSGYAGVLGPFFAECTENGNCQEYDPFPAGTCNIGEGICNPDSCAFIDTNRSDYVFSGLSGFAPMSYVTLDYGYLGALMNPATGPTYGGVDKYCGTLVLNVPEVGAAGSYTIGFIDNPALTNVYDSTGAIRIVPLNLNPATIMVKCADADDCDDGDECTDNICNGDGSCSYPPNYNEEVYCCDPVTGDLTEIDDGNDCTEDICNPDGTVDHNNRPPDYPCGDQEDTDCTDPDTCDGSGTCLDNHADLGDPCGNQDDTDCTDPDTCDGAGTCLDNHADFGDPCGDPQDTDCTDPDTCDSNGNCEDNHAPNGADCDDGLYCNVDEECTDGECGGGTDRDCSDGLACTTDTCDEELDQCENDLDPGFCLISGICRTQGEVNPANDCEECNTALSTTNWSFRPNGISCDDGLYCNVDEVCTDGECGGGSDRDCDDGFDCTDDSCNEVGDQCENDPNDSLCPDDGLYCNGDEVCDPDNPDPELPVSGCGHANEPCSGPCDEENDECLCEAPVVVGTASRYMVITPEPQGGETKMWLVVTGDCPGGISRYVGGESTPIPFDRDGDGFPESTLAFLVEDQADAPKLTPAEWGGTVYVTGAELAPGMSYIIHADCGTQGSPGLSEPGTGETWARGNVDGDPAGMANLTDILLCIAAFQGDYSSVTVDRADQMGVNAPSCQPDQVVSLQDLMQVVLTFQGVVPYTCDDLCP